MLPNVFAIDTSHSAQFLSTGEYFCVFVFQIKWEGLTIILKKKIQNILYGFLHENLYIKTYVNK